MVIMRIRCQKHRTLELALCVFLTTVGNVLLVEGRRPVLGGGDSSDDTRIPIDIPRNEDALHGYRGRAGTLGVLIAAALVIPAGVIAVLYLLYIYVCGQKVDGLDSAISGGSREWSGFGQKGVVTANASWPKMDGLVIEAKQEEMFTSMSEKTDDLKAERSELVSLMSSVECCEPTPCDSGEAFTTNGSIKDPVIPGSEAIIQSTEVNQTDPININHADPLTENQDFQNTVEIFVTGDDAGDNETVSCDTSSSSSRTTTSNQPLPMSFKQTTKPPVVNEVHVNLRLVDSPKAARTNEKYVSEVMLFLPCARTDAGWF